MKFLRLRQVAWAQIQCCGLWLQIGATIVGVFPSRWWTDRSSRNMGWHFGVKLWAADHSGGSHTAFGVETDSWRLSYKRAFSIVSFTGEPIGWQLWRRRQRAHRAA